MTEPGRGGHELRWARGRNAYGVPPLALARGGSPGSETALLRSCPPLPPRQCEEHVVEVGRLHRNGLDVHGLLIKPVEQVSQRLWRAVGGDVEDERVGVVRLPPQN